MFEVEKPRRFHYEPRFYDPEKEKWEALKKKYAEEKEKEESVANASDNAEDGEKDELAYFQQRVRDINKEQLAASSRLTWRDLFRKREMPKFNYQPRFSSGVQPQPTNEDEASPEETLTDKYRQAKRQIKIRRRFDFTDSEYMKPIPATKIMLYGFIVFLLIMLIIAF